MINSFIWLSDLDADKLESVPTDLSKLSNVVKTDPVKREVYNATNRNIEDKTPSITNIATNAALIILWKD